MSSAITHHLQRTILRNLGSFDQAHFSEIKPSGVDGNIYSYHLQQLIKQGYINKTADGLYRLTSEGKNFLVTNGRSNRTKDIAAHSVLLLAVRRGDDWLVRKRLIQPNLDLIGFVHGEPQSYEGATVTAKKRLAEKTGLEANFVVSASGLIRIWKKDSLESFSNCLLLYAQNPSGDLVLGDATGENMWVSSEAFAQPNYLPSMHDMLDILSTPNEPVFFDKTYQIS